MKLEYVEEFAQCLGQDLKQSMKKGWVSIHCPLAPWEHEHGTDFNPSFGIRVNPGGVSRYNCFTCGCTGELMDLLLELKQHDALGDYDAQGMMQLIALEDSEIGVVEVEGTASYADVMYGESVKDFEFPEEWLDGFPPAWDFPEVKKMLKQRLVPHHVANDMDIRWDASRERICFPVRDFAGSLKGLHGRTTIGQEPKYLAYTYESKTCPEVWLGEHGLDATRPVVVVEGPFDIARVSQVYRNVVCPLGTALNASKLKRMKSVYSIVTFFDPDKAGNKARSKVAYEFKGKLPVHHVYPSEGEDAGSTPLDEIDELLGQYVPREYFE